MRTRSRDAQIVLAVALCCVINASDSFAQIKAPSISITAVPVLGGGKEVMEFIGGTTAEAPKGSRVVLFAHADVWWVQPYSESDAHPDGPTTLLDENGDWHNDTHLGSEYAALLVTADYRPPATASVLPSVGGKVLARVVVPAVSRAVPTADRSATDPTGSPSASASISIIVTEVPKVGAGDEEMARIEGTVSGAPPGARVVLFARTDRWLVQPTSGVPDHDWPRGSNTPIDERGRWQNDTYLGQEYAALLVTDAYDPPSETLTLPGVGGAVLARVTVPGRPSASTPTGKALIAITKVPKAGVGEDHMEGIAGTTSGAPPAARVVLFAYTDKWRVQPYRDATSENPNGPYTAIQESNKWSNLTRRGSRYAAMLVTADYKPPSVTRKLPAVGGAVLATAEVTARR